MLGLGSAIAVYSYFSSLERRELEDTGAAGVEVLVATRNIPVRAVLTREMFSQRSVPPGFVHPQALRSPDEAVGKVVVAEIMAGEQLLRNRLDDVARIPALAFNIPPNRQAVTVSVNETLGVAGFVKPGDRVDVLATFDEGLVGQDLTVSVLQNTPVLAVAQKMEKGADSSVALVVRSVTLEVTAEEARRVTLAEEKGRIRLALRSALEFSSNHIVVSDGPSSKQTGVATLAELTGVTPVAKPSGSRAGGSPPESVASSDRSQITSPPSPVPTQVTPQGREEGVALAAATASRGPTVRVASPGGAEKEVADAVEERWVVEVIRGSQVSYVDVSGSAQ